MTVLANYFVRWRHVAFAASAAGTGIGTLMMPQFLQLLLQEYGPQSAYILMAGELPYQLLSIFKFCMAILETAGVLLPCKSPGNNLCMEIGRRIIAVIENPYFISKKLSDHAY